MATLSQFLDYAFTITMAFFSIILLELAILIAGPARTATFRSITAEQFLKMVDQKAPVSRYAIGGAPIELPECRVCLSVYEEGDQVRGILKCEHTFHKDCLDMWLLQHRHSATCPLCRLAVLPEEVAINHRNRRQWEDYEDDEEELMLLYTLNGNISGRFNLCETISSLVH